MKRLFFGFVVLLVSVNTSMAAIVTADVAVHSPDGQYAPLKVGELNSNWDRYYWYEVPTFAQEQNVFFWQYEHTGFPTWQDGITTFDVLTDGPVLMACTTRWGGGGNSDGDWEDELTTREQLEGQGWVEFATGLGIAEVGLPYPGVEYIVFRRDSIAGETFTYRTEKYEPPLILTVPEPSSLTLLFLGAICLFSYKMHRKGRR